ncbi:uncharacterized protein LOC113334662 [Papaver somniferum]|uniref:uncharacterized protein LOC113334662 n=1 Tax=Papaver somniferum TaxID=3469 RepID=UPI000E6F9DCC|nr:uncharacterized protein LOC113334662 [Papaver somniferum]
MQQWNIPLLRQLSPADQVNSILTIPLQLDQEDKLVWPFTSSGIFTTASAYKMFCEKDLHIDISMGLSQQFWLAFWKLKVPYKFQIFMWKGIHDVVPVKARIFRHLNTDDKLCVLCSMNQTEDLDHLLLHCSFSQAIWQNFFPNQFISIVQHPSVLSWIQTWHLKDFNINIKQTPQAVHLALCIIHFIWKHRCRDVFSNMTPNHHTFIHQINSYRAHHHLDTSFVDHAGIRIIIRNSTGAYAMGKGTLKRAINIQQAEAWALLEAMQIAATNGWSKVIFETDNLSISSFLQHQTSICQWQCLPLLRNCVNMYNSYPVWSYEFVYKSCNKTADALANAARKHNLCGDWWSCPPDFLIPYINHDVRNLLV